MYRRKSNSGFTLIELLVTVAILAVLMILSFVAFNLQRARGFDARRKSDLAKLKVALEDYYNDKRCYPPAATLGRCGLGDLKPYLDKVPCDPASKKPYGYTVDAACTYYAVFATLDDSNDPAIKDINCSPRCNPNAPYNYGVTNSGLSLSTLAQQAH